jgi:hypothetical protein
MPGSKTPEAITSLSRSQQKAQVYGLHCRFCGGHCKRPTAGVRSQEKPFHRVFLLKRQGLDGYDPAKRECL